MDIYILDLIHIIIRLNCRYLTILLIYMSSHSTTSKMSGDSGVDNPQTQGRNKIDTLIVLDTLVADNSELTDVSVNISIETSNLFADLSMQERVVSKHNNLDTFGSLYPDRKIKILNPFSAPIGYFDKVRAGEAYVDIFETETLKINEITSDDNKINVYRPDLSFNKSVNTNNGIFNGIYALQDNIQFDVDVSTNNEISVSDVNVNKLQGPIKINGDLSLQNIQNVSDISLTNNLDISLLEIINLGSYSGAKIIIHSDASFEGIQANNFYVNNFTQIGPVNSDLSVNFDLSVNGETNLANLTSSGIIGIHNDASFEHLHIKDLSVNTISTITPDEFLLIKGDVSINNSDNLEIEIEQTVINQLQVGQLNDLVGFTKSAFSMVENRNNKMTDLYYATPAGNFGSLEMEDNSINDIYFTDISLSELSYNDTNNAPTRYSKKLNNVGNRQHTFIIDELSYNDQFTTIDISSKTTYELKIEYGFDQKYSEQNHYDISTKLIVEPCKSDISYFFKGDNALEDSSGSVGPNSDIRNVELLYNTGYCFTFHFQTNIVEDISMLITLRDNVIGSDTHKTNTSGNTISRILDINCGGPDGINNDFDDIYNNY